MQDTYASVLKRRHVIHGDGDIYYLLRALRNTYFSQRRAAARRPRAADVALEELVLPARAPTRPTQRRRPRRARSSGRSRRCRMSTATRSWQSTWRACPTARPQRSWGCARGRSRAGCTEPAANGGCYKRRLTGVVPRQERGGYVSAGRTAHLLARHRDAPGDRRLRRAGDARGRAGLRPALRAHRGLRQRRHAVVREADADRARLHPRAPRRDGPGRRVAARAASRGRPRTSTTTAGSARRSRSTTTATSPT